MDLQDFSLRENLLKNAKIAFEFLLETVENKPSKPVIVRELTKAFHRQEEEIGKLCDRMEKRLKDQKETLLSAFKEKVGTAFDEIITASKQSGNVSPTEIKKGLDQYKEVGIFSLNELDRQYNEYASEWGKELESELTLIINRFYDESIRIMSGGIAADVAMEFLDPDSAPKQ